MGRIGGRRPPIRGQLAFERVTAWVVVVAFELDDVVDEVAGALVVTVVAEEAPVDPDPLADTVAGVADAVVASVPASDADTAPVAVDAEAVDAVDAVVVAGWVWAMAAAPPRTPATPAAVTAARDRQERRQRFRVAVDTRWGARCSVMGNSVRPVGKARAAVR